MAATRKKPAAARKAPVRKTMKAPSGGAGTRARKPQSRKR